MRFVRMGFREAEKLKGADIWEAELKDLYDNEMGRFVPNKQAYRVMDDQGVLKCVVALTDDNELAGAAAILVTKSMHMSVPLVIVDVLYMRKEYRQGQCGVRLMREVERLAKDQGATGLGLNTIPGSSYDKLCAARGYLLARNTYWRPL